MGTILVALSAGLLALILWLRARGELGRGDWRRRCGSCSASRASGRWRC